MIQFSFDLFGFDLLFSDGIVGFWVGQVKDWSDYSRSLLCIHYDNSEWRVELLFVRLI